MERLIRADEKTGVVAGWVEFSPEPGPQDGDVYSSLKYGVMMETSSYYTMTQSESHSESGVLGEAGKHLS